MKLLLMLLALTGTQCMSASEAQSEKINKQMTLDLLIKKDLLIQVNRPLNRVSRMDREGPAKRVIRENRVIYMGKNSKNIRVARDVRSNEEIPTIRMVRCERETRDIKISKIIRKAYITQLLK